MVIQDLGSLAAYTTLTGIFADCGHRYDSRVKVFSGIGGRF
jgi:hypothetical protein